MIRKLPDKLIYAAKRLEGVPGTGEPVLTSYKGTGLSEPWTIGWGHTGPDTGERRTITRVQAESLLMSDLYTASAVVDKLIAVPLNENQWGALVLFVLNIGEANFRASTLRERLNAGKYDDVPAQLARWVYATNTVGEKIILPGLQARRATETALWLTPVGSDNPVGPEEHPGTAGATPTPPPAPGNVLETSTGKATAGATAMGTGAAVIVGAQQVGPIVDALHKVATLSADLPQVMLVLAVAGALGCIGFTGWTLFDRRRKLRQEGK